MKRQTFINGVRKLSSKNEVFDMLHKKLGLIEYEPRSLNFISFCKIIIGQQLSSKAAETIFNRFYKVSADKLNPQTVLSLEEDDFRSAGVSRGKAEYIKNLAEILSNDPDFIIRMYELPSNDAYEVLIKIKGIGPWTANIIQLFYLGDIDIFPIGDASLEKVYSSLFNKKISSKNIKSYEHIRWASPYKGILAMYLWDYLDSGLFKQLE